MLPKRKLRDVRSSASIETGTATLSSLSSSWRSRRGRRVSKGSANPSSIDPASRRTNQQRNRRVLFGRYLFALILASAAATLGWAAHSILSSSEKELLQLQFRVVAQGALLQFKRNFARKTEAFSTLEELFQHAFPDPESWPFVTLPGFSDVATSLIKAVDGCAIAYMPVVEPAELAEFEAFAYHHYYNESGYPPTLAQSSFGRGVWGTNKSLNTTDQRYHDTENNYYTPVLQHSAGAYQKFLMMNFWTDLKKQNSIQDALACVEARRTEPAGNTVCRSLANTFLHPKLGPTSLGTQPITLQSDNTTAVGFIHSPVSWEWVMKEVDESMEGLAFILTSNGGDAWTWQVENGSAVLLGEGHEFFPSLYLREHPELDLEVSMVINAPEMYPFNAPEFTITVVPTEGYCDVFMTKNPWLAMAGAILIIVFTSMFFILYDWLVHEEFNARLRLLKAKREFMRFISHEVRTPLNSVCMGLTLLEEELQGKEDDYASKSNDESSLSISVPNSPRHPRADFVMKSEELLLVQQVQRNAQSAVDVLNDLLNYDKIEGGELSLELELLDIWGLVKSTVAEFELPCQLKNLILVSNLDIDPFVKSLAVDKQKADSRSSAPLQIVGDPIRLVQVIRNLISNAIKFTPENGSISIDARWSEPTLGKMGQEQDVALHAGRRVLLARSGNFQLSVKDSGVGMTKAQLSKLFHSGVQFDVNQLQGGKGSGLGLYISKGIIEQHGGILSVESEGLGKGTIFTLSIPTFVDPNTVALPRESPVLQDESMPTSPGSALPLLEDDESGPLHVLVVDDSVSNRKLLMRLLEKRGHTVIGCENGQEAVDFVRQSLEHLKSQHLVGPSLEGDVAKDHGKLHNRTFDVICMDSQMPVMNGPTACTEIRELGCDAYIVGITGNVMPEDIAIFKAHGANAVLPKPFRVLDLEDLWMEHHVGANMKKKTERRSNSSALRVEFYTDDMEVRV